MSSGMPSDWENTKAQLNNPYPVIKNRTWLNHGVNTQAGIIDLMVLEGTHSIEHIASKIPEASNPIKRVKDHLEHLQEGDSRQKNTDMKPHRLHIVTGANGAVMFSSENIKNIGRDLISDKNSYTPIKEDFELAYRALVRLGETIFIDSVLNQIEINTMNKGLLLENNWRIITETKIAVWSNER